MPKSAYVVLIVTAMVGLAWLVWGVREYQRTGRTQWLWLAGVLLLSVIAMFSQMQQLLP